MSAEELLPCPFCGAAASVKTRLRAFVSCDVCGSMIDEGFDAASNQAIAAWNRRTPIKPSDDIGELRKRVAKIVDPVSSCMVGAGYEAFQVYEWSFRNGDWSKVHRMLREVYLAMAAEGAGDTGELRDDILERLRALDFAGHYDEARFQYIADAILDLIQSERAG